MTKSLFALLAVSVLALSACSDHHHRSATDLPPGKYERTSKSTDAYGTDREREDVTEVEVDEYGNKKAVVKSKTVTDPKGLFNKRVTKSKQVIKEQN